LIGGLVRAAMALENSNASTILGWFATWFNHVLKTFGGYAQDTYYEHAVNGATFVQSDSAGTPFISADSQWGYYLGSHSWSRTKSPHFSVDWSVGPHTAGRFVNGDMVTWDFRPNAGMTAVPGGFTPNKTQYYVRNVSGSGSTQSYDLTATPGLSGGSIIVPTDDFAGGAQPWIRFTNPPAATVVGGIQNYPSGSAYIANFLASVRLMMAAGIGGLTAVESDAATRVRANSIVLDPKFSVQKCYNPTCP
jgi:hypothetical protein